MPSQKAQAKIEKRCYALKLKAYNDRKALEQKGIRRDDWEERNTSVAKRDKCRGGSTHRLVSHKDL